MSIFVPRVFISSTSEFAAERELLRQQIEDLPDVRLAPYIYEADSAGATPPEERLRDVLDHSEIFLLILGDTFGSEYPGRATSIVEWEYEYAREARKEIKGYVKNPLGPSLDPRQAAFIARVVAFRDGSWVRKFGETKQMIGTAIGDLRKWVLDAGTLWIRGEHERNQWKDRLVMVSCAVVALITIAGMVAGTLLGVPMGKLAVVFACGLSMFGGLSLLLRSKVF
jgi:hypothetical protein